MRLSVVLSGVVAALVGFGGTLALIVAAAQAVGADPAETSSWVAALCLAVAATTIYLSVRYRMPIVTAWSTPGAALIAASAGGIGLNQAVGAFLFCGLLIVLTAAFRPLADFIERLPKSVAAAMLAGVLLRFVVAVFESAGSDPLLVLPLVGLFLVVRLFTPAGAPLVVLAAGLALAFSTGLMGDLPGAELSDLVLISPVFEPSVLIGLGLPLYIVTMASQNLTGFAVLRAAGYAPPTRAILAVTGLGSLVTAPFGAHASNLAAITAAICSGPDTHPDPAKRWPAGTVFGLSFLVLAAFGASLVALLSALPEALIVTVAGTALIGPLMGALGAAWSEERERFAATLTLAVTVSGFAAFGIGSAFWGLVAGLVAMVVEAAYRKVRPGA